MSEELPNNDRKEQAIKKAREFGPMSLTGDEHYLIGSTPPKQLIDNPGKNSIDLMSDEDIKNYLEGQSKSMEELISLVGKDSRMVRDHESQHQGLLKYLKQVGRLPEGF